MAIYKLGDIGDWATSKQSFSDNFVTTANMHSHLLPEFTTGLGKKYSENSILMSNIRPYFNKVWFSDRVGTHSGDVLNFVVNKELAINRYVFYILSSNDFNKFWNITSKGTKMPRGDKEMMLTYLIDLPSIQKQQEIIDIIEHAESLFLKFNKCVRINTVENAKNDMKALIDIIEPIEKTISELNFTLSSLMKIIKNMKPNGKVKFKDAAVLIKNKPKNINQVSAKILVKRNPSIQKYEKPNTYKTNSFFAPKGTLVINTIRTYLEKFGILYEDADVNGTLAQFKVDDKYESSILKALLNNDFWSIAMKMSHGTKMPVIKKQDILDIEIELIEPIDNLFNTIISINSAIKLNEQIKEKIISLLIK